MPEGDAAGGSWPDFIVDTPAEADGLNAHARVASAIASVIRNRSKVKMIGLLGDWGSGKSTVVRLVERDLAQGDDPPRYFVYDTWLRQSDPPRRAFLEGLVTYLAQTDIPAVHRELKKWRASLSELDGTSATTFTATTVELSRAGLHLLPLLVLMPLGFKLIGDGTPKDGSAAAIALNAAGWLLSLGPALMALYLRSRGLKFAEILAVFTNRGGDAKHEVRSHSPDPTAIEFQARFEAIVTTLRGAGERLVIVVDNLDRLPPAEALTLWSTLRSFFLEANHANGISRADMPVILVPLDPTAPGRIHSDKAEGDDQLSRSFVEKTFDVVFHVPPPVLSSWQDYLRQRMQEVFGASMRREWPDTVAAIYETLQRSGAGDLGTTPRSLNSFVNALAVLHMQWRDDAAMTMAAMAYFVCRRAEIEADIRKAFEKDAAGITDYDPDWQASVASLYYGVPRDRARELYLGEPIRAAIAAADGEEFGRLAQSPSFDRYFDQVLESPTPPRAINTARVLGHSSVAKAPWLSQAWRKVRAMTIATVSQAPLAPDDHLAVDLLLSSLDEPERPRWLLLLAGRWRVASSEPILEAPDAAADFFDAMTRAAHDHGVPAFGIALPDDLRVYIALLATRRRVEGLAALQPRQGAEAVLNLLAGMLRNPDTAAEGREAAAQYALLAPENARWSEVVNSIGDVLDNREPKLVAHSFCVMADVFPHVQAVRDAVIDLRNEGRLREGWSRLPSDASDESLAAAVALCLGVQAHIVPNAGGKWPELLDSRPGLSKLIAEGLSAFYPEDELSWALALSETYHDLAPLVQEVVVAQVLGQEPAFAGEYLLADLPGYFRLLHVPAMSSFWAAAARVKGFWGALEAVDLERATPIYAMLATIEGSKSQLGTSVKAVLSSMDASDWDAAVFQGAHPWPLVEAMSALANRAQSLSGRASKRLRSQIQTLLSDPVVTPRRRWFHLLTWLDAAERTATMDALRSALSDYAGPDLVEFLELGGRELYDAGQWFTDPGQCTAFIKRVASTSHGLEWLDEHTGVAEGWFKSLPEALRLDLVDEISQQIGGDGYVRLRQKLAELEA